MKFVLLAALLPLAAFAQNYDLVIRNAHVIDGTGSPWYAADIGIERGRIAAIGRLEITSAKSVKIIDARGLIAAPGFIVSLFIWRLRFAKTRNRSGPR